MSEELISVIVPIYNVERYLEKCIESIINQTYQNLEIILVDDGSTDKSGEIVDRYIQADNRIRVIHKINGGLSDARNHGLDIAQGNCIAFVDSDDYIDRNMIKILKQNMDSCNADISFCSFTWDYEENTNEETVYSNDIEKYQGINKWMLLYNNNLETVVAWNKLYKKNIFSNIRYALGILHEDEEIIHKILERAGIVCYTNDKLYHYIKRNDSIVSNYTAKHFRDATMALYNRMKFFENIKYKELVYHAQKMYMLYVVNNIEKLYPSYISVKELKTIKKRFILMWLNREYRKFIAYDSASYTDIKKFIKVIRWKK
jgi:glycosyltransferase involved in cell wall biosynthesis